MLAPEAFAKALPAGARLLGLDVGTKTVGVALSDVTRTIASGVTTIARTKFAADARRLLELAQEHGVGGFVIGLPISLDGSEGPRAQATRAFTRNLVQLTPLPILLWDERLTTAAAERSLLEADVSRRRRAQVIDKVAATLILQSALDRLKLLDPAEDWSERGHMTVDAFATPLDLAALAYFLLAIGLYRMVAGRALARGAQLDRSHTGAARALDAQHGQAREPHARCHPARQPRPGQRLLRLHQRHRRGRIGRNHGLGREGAGDSRRAFPTWLRRHPSSGKPSSC